MAVSQPDLNPGVAPSSTSRLDLWSRIVAVAIAVLLPIQALMGSDAFMKNNEDARNMHEMMGNVFFLLSAALLVLGFFAMRNGSLGTTGVALRVVLVLLVVAQLGLGYSGRDDVDLKIWHIANGVLLMGVSTVVATMTFFRRNPA
jgi:hypothetical protein